MKIPLISFKEIQKQDNPRRSKHFKGFPIRISLDTLSNQKARGMSAISRIKLDSRN
jgi:hypothetical protein